MTKISLNNTFRGTTWMTNVQTAHTPLYVQCIYSAWAGLRRFPASWLDYNIRIVVMIRLVFGGVLGWLGIACN